MEGRAEACCVLELGCGGAAADRCTLMRPHRVVESDAGSNHHFRAANHRVLDTFLGWFKLIIAFGGRMEGVVSGYGGCGGAAAYHACIMNKVLLLVLTTTSKPAPTTA